MRVPTKWEKEEADREEEERKKKRDEYEETFRRKYVESFNKVFETGGVHVTLAYLLSIFVTHLLSHDRTHMPSQRSTCVHDIAF